MRGWFHWDLQRGFSAEAETLVWVVKLKKWDNIRGFL